MAPPVYDLAHESGMTTIEKSEANVRTISVYSEGKFGSGLARASPEIGESRADASMR